MNFIINVNLFFFKIKESCIIVLLLEIGWGRSESVGTLISEAWISVASYGARYAGCKVEGGFLSFDIFIFCVRVYVRMHLANENSFHF